jgi:outer membrane protein
VQANVTQAWGQLEAAKAQIDAAQSQVTAAEVALNGVREDARVGQRTTLDVFNAQQALVNARASWPPIPCWRRPVRALTADPRAQDRGLRVVHYQQVRDALGRHVLILSPTRAQLKGSSRRSASACGVARTLTLHSSH